MENQFGLEEDQIITNNSYLFDSTGLPLPMPMDLESHLGLEAPRIVNSMSPKHIENEKYQSLSKIISNVLKNLNESERSILRLKLKGHFGLYEDGNPWVDFEAAWLLSFHSDLSKAQLVQLPTKPPLHDGIKFSLSEGRYVPMQHILNSLHLSQFNPKLENYPLSFSAAVPIEFLQTIKRSDILRAINIHALFVGKNFPIIGSQFAYVREIFWNFMFLKGYPPSAGLDLYNEYFFYVSCELGKGILAPLDKIPADIKEKVKAKYKKSH